MLGNLSLGDVLYTALRGLFCLGLFLGVCFLTQGFHERVFDDHGLALFIRHRRPPEDHPPGSKKPETL